MKGRGRSGRAGPAGRLVRVALVVSSLIPALAPPALAGSDTAGARPVAGVFRPFREPAERCILGAVVAATLVGDIP